MFFRAKYNNACALIILALVLVSFPVLSQSSNQNRPFLQSQQPVGLVLLAANDSDPDAAESLPSAVVWYLEMAEQGDKDAQYNLGSIYETGFGVDADMKEAVNWYNKAAQQGHQMAQLKLGMMYYLGRGAKQSIIKGNKWIREAAKSGNTLALLLQENVIAHDAEKDIEPEKLMARTLLAFDKGQINAEETLRLELQKIERARKTAEQKTRFAGTVTGSAAKAGSVKNEVPDFLNKNPQTLGSSEHSLIAIRRLALEGDAKAQYELGRRYETGDEVAENLEEAFKWYTASATQDYTEAQYRLGLAYLYGIGTKQSTAQGGVWLKKARDKLHPAATMLLNAISSNRSGIIDKSHSILLSWYLERSIEGDGDAMLGLGNMFEHGWGIEQDVETAKRWYAKARAAGTKGASIRMRQIKAEAAADAESSPDPGPQQSQRALSRDESEAEGASGTEASGTGGLESRLSDYLTPAALLVLGLFMGVLVFRWMKGGNRQDSAF